MLINLSNHSVNNWSDEQKSTATSQYGNIIDLAFPTVDPLADEPEIEKMAEVAVNKCLDIFSNNKSTEINAVHVMGEMTLTFALVKKLQIQHIQCIASTTARKTTENADGWKNSYFKFCRFRKYM